MDWLFKTFHRYWLLGEVFYTLLILAGAGMIAKIIDRVLRKLIRVSEAGDNRLRNYIVQALRRPVIYLVLLIGIYAVLHRLPLGQRPYRYLDGIIFSLGVIIVLSLLLRVFAACLRWYQRKIQAHADTHLEADFLPLIDKLMTILIILIGSLIIMDHFHIDVKSLLVTLGVGSLAIGLALQDTLANMFGGFTIMLDRPFRIGDYIQLAGGESGHVVNIGMRSTQLRTGDNNILSIPNSLLVKNMITNHSYPDNRIVVKARIIVERGVDIEPVRQLMLHAALSVEEVLTEPAPEVFFTEFADSGLTLLLLVSVKDYRFKLKLLDKVNERIYTSLRTANIPLAPTAQMVYIKTNTDGGPTAS